LLLGCLAGNNEIIYNSWNDCMIAGYEQSLEFLKASGPEQINKNELYVKFVCLENMEEENT
jgi:hypothetical protein